MSDVGRYVPSATTPEQGRGELRSFIRYALSKLRSRNEHHRFEHLCEAIARQRITPNIVAGTGPVSAGGDQGRDFESFIGFAHGRLRDLGARMGISEQASIVFCCTTEQGDLIKKINSDLDRLTASGSSVDVVVYFCEQDMPTATRHKVIDTASNAHHVRLEVLDGQSITGILCDRDTFWVAVDFLDVPTHLAPIETGPEWYESSRNRWLTRSSPASTSGDVVELTACLRFATHHDASRGDIEMWLDRFAPLLVSDVDVQLKRRARYETAVARLRGLGDLRPADSLVRDLLREATTSDYVEELDSAETICMYAQGAWLFSATDLTAEEIETFASNIESHVRQLLEMSPASERRSRLLWVLGRLSLRSDLTLLHGKRSDRKQISMPPPMSKGKWETLLKERPQGTREPLLRPVNPAGALTAWSEVVDLLDFTPLFPVLAFAESVSLRASELEEHSDWLSLVSRLDVRVAQVSGKQATAGLARYRSRSLRAAGRPFRALAELHAARTDLMGADTRDEGAEALLETAQIYLDLGLLYAAKHYALAGGALAAAEDDDDHPLIASSLILTCHCDFLAGNWFSMMALLPSALAAHANLRFAANELLEWEDLMKLLWFLGVVTQFVRRSSDPKLSTWVTSRIERGGVDREELAGGEVPELLPEGDEQSVARFVYEQLGQAPFVDTGSNRVITFSANGVRWRIRSHNTFDDVRAAERFAAATQTLIGALGEIDLVLVETTVDVRIRTVKPRAGGKPRRSEPKLAGRPEDQTHAWEVTLTRDLGPHSVEALAATAEVAGTAAALLTSLSLLPTASLKPIIEEVVETGSMFRAIFPHIRYDRAYAVLSHEDFDEDERRYFKPLGPLGYGEPVLSDQLAPRRDPGPVFRGETPEERVSGRYGAYAKTLRITVPRLSAEASFQEVVSTLRAKGWKDWHLLMAISNQVLNFRIEVEDQDVSDPAIRDRLMSLEPEDPLSPQIEPANVTVEALERWLMTSVGATVDAFGLEIRGPFSQEEILGLLANRYDYWGVDSPHLDPFQPGGSPFFK